MFFLCSSMPRGRIGRSAAVRPLPADASCPRFWRCRGQVSPVQLFRGILTPSSCQGNAAAKSCVLTACSTAGAPALANGARRGAARQSRAWGSGKTRYAGTISDCAASYRTPTSLRRDRCRCPGRGEPHLGVHRAAQDRAHFCMIKRRTDGAGKGRDAIFPGFGRVVGRQCFAI